MKDPNPITPSPKDIAVQQSLHHTEEKYKAIVENSIHAFFLSVPDGTILKQTMPLL